LNKIKILILGSSGFLGSSIYNNFKNKFKIFGHSFSKDSDIKFDLLNKGEVSNYFNILDPDIIINCVALADVDLCEINQKIAYNLNVNVVKNIIRFKKKETWLIHFSTDHVYDENILNNEDNTNLSNYYSKTKFESEEYVLRGKGLILRTNFFGKSFNLNKQSFNEWIEFNLKNNINFNIVRDIFFSPISLETLKNRLEVIIKKFYLMEGIYNIGSSTYMSKYDFAIKVMENLNGFDKGLYKAIDSEKLFKTYRPKYMQMNNNKISKIIGELPSLEEEINTIYNGN